MYVQSTSSLYHCRFAPRSTKASLSIVLFLNDKVLRATQVVMYSTVVGLCYEAVLWRTHEIKVSKYRGTANLRIISIFKELQINEDFFKTVNFSVLLRS